MKKPLIVIVIIGALISLAFAVGVIIKIPAFQTQFDSEKTDEGFSNIEEIQRSDMKLRSLAFENNAQIPSKYTCDGVNVSPPLQISDIPTDTKSLVLIVDDPDAPAGDWVHWLVWNINPDVSEIAEGEVPRGGVQGLTDFGDNEYKGPCPPSGSHRYQFKLYALDTTLDLPAQTRKAELEKEIQDHVLEWTMLVGVYKKS